ncbi:uncharacterized protein [Argopecten irradians]|uniref:uncharacterized protein n=1 Tax=Argopecten irradians TaxID=31199 RepID=UPI00371F80B5
MFLSAMKRAVLCFLLSLATGSWAAIKPRPVLLSAGRFLQANPRPLFTGNNGPYPNVIQKPGMPNPMTHAVNKPSNNAGLPLALANGYLRPHEQSFSQGMFGHHSGWEANSIATRPKVIPMTLVKPNRPMLGLLKQLMSGKFLIKADAIHLDAIPIAERPTQPNLEGMVIEPSMVSVQVPNQPVQPIYFESPKPLRPNLGQQVPFELLLQEFKELDSKINSKPNVHGVTFASLYQNYMKLLEKQNKTTLPIKSTTTVPSTTVQTESTPPTTTSESTKTTVTVTAVPTTSALPTNTKDIFGMIHTSLGQATDDKPVIRLPGMGPDASS